MAIEGATNGRDSSANPAIVSFHKCDRQQRVELRRIRNRGCRPTAVCRCERSNRSKADNRIAIGEYRSGFGQPFGTVARLSGCTIFWAVVRLHKCMDSKLGPDGTMAAHDRSVSEAFMRERARLRSFIRKRVPDPADAEDLLQEVFYELVQAARLVQPVEHVGAWLFRVTRNRITDLFRRTKSVQIEAPESIPIAESAELGEPFFEDLLPAADGGPEAVYARRLLLEELDAALDELPEEQRSVFIAHELEGQSFKELARETDTSVNTLLSRKRYAVLHLRQRLRAIYDEFVDT